MKKCDYFKELILTDFIDGELDKDAGASVENHLLDCSECRAFFKEVKNNAALPFQKAVPQPVPAGLWGEIRQKIEHQNQPGDLLADFMDKLKGLVFFPRMVPLFASLLLMIIAGSVALNTVQVQQDQAIIRQAQVGEQDRINTLLAQNQANLRLQQAKDQGEYLVALLSSTGPSTAGDNNDLGTPIEHYFL